MKNQGDSKVAEVGWNRAVDMPRRPCCRRPNPPSHCARSGFRPVNSCAGEICWAGIHITAVAVTTS